MRILTTLIALIVFSSSYSQDLIFDTSLLNSYADEQFPVLSKDGRLIYYTRSHHEDNVDGKKDKGDIYFSQLTDSIGWTSPKKVIGPNNKYFNSALELKEELLYVYGEYRSDKTPIPGVSMAESTNWPESWSSPQKQDIKYFKNNSANLGISISEDGSIMVISMESYKTKGAEDLYVSFKTQNSWSEPKNLGPVVNTALQELTPFLGADNKTLFFASNGHEGYGSRDIFVTQRQDESWTNWSVPENLGILVNTEGAEMGYRLYPELELAIYSSTMDSDGYGDIRIIPVTEFDAELIAPQEIVVPEAVTITSSLSEESTIEEGKVLLFGNIFDSSTGELVLARTKILDNEDITEHYNDSTYSFPVTPSKAYTLQIDAEGYISKNIKVEVFDENQSEDIFIDAIEVGVTVKLDNVLFVKGTTDMISSSFKELDLIIDMMLNNPTMEIELSGHTDNVGVATLNQRLSQERVDVVIAYLAEKGIEKSRLSGKGYGGSKPIASNANESSRRLNRRVEFTILHQ